MAVSLILVAVFVMACLLQRHLGRGAISRVSRRWALFFVFASAGCIAVAGSALTLQHPWMLMLGMAVLVVLQVVLYAMAV